MSNANFLMESNKPHIVGSFGDIQSLRKSSPTSLQKACDIAEIRLDLFYKEWESEGSKLWEHLRSFPLLFTARSSKEGSPIKLSHCQRMEMLGSSLSQASIVDIEAEEIHTSSSLITQIQQADKKWVASYHNFQGLADLGKIQNLAEAAEAQGASCFKTACKINHLKELNELIETQTQLAFTGTKAFMGMGELATVSRLLAAQYGSALNFGFIGSKPTAPGQWSAYDLKQAVNKLPLIESAL